MTDRSVPETTTREGALELLRAGKLPEARAALEALCTAEPHDPVAVEALTRCLLGLGRYGKAARWAREFAALQPASAEPHYLLATALANQGRLPEAAGHYREALERDPDHIDALLNLAGACQFLGRFDEALSLYGRMLALAPARPDVHLYYGIALSTLGRQDDAIRRFREGLTLAPDSAELHNQLGLACTRSGRVDEAVASYREALRLQPDQAEYWNNLGGALDAQGEGREGLECHRRAVALAPGFVDAYSSVLFALHYQADYHGEQAFAEYREWNRRYAEPLRASIRPHDNDRDPERRLRIGYVSSDFWDHVTNCFFEPVLEQHDRKRFEIFCYNSNARADAVTARLKGLADHWRDIAAMSDEQAARQIRADRIDILVDLKGHTEGNRLLLFARKPAPVQATWLGYPNTTGLDTIDWCVIDRHIANADMTDQYHSESLARLPDFYMCFRPKGGQLDPGPLPARRNGFVTFGSFNTITKLTPETTALWARILAAVPDSKLLMIAIPAGQAQAAMRKRFTDAGIATDRLLLRERIGHDEFMALHRDTDLALDPFPYCGTTTALHDLWMGTPIVTLAGRFHASRVGASILENLGLPELIARSEDDYVRIAAALASDLDRLARLRAELRPRLAASPLMVAPRFARNLESAYRDMWQAWCRNAG
jgi:protein O-GlcNAc transferase